MMDYKEDIKRWRLILGKDTQDTFSSMNSEAISSLSEEDWLMDRALDAIYNPSGKFMGDAALGAGRGPSNPQISKWLGDVRDLFDKELVKIIQTDAMDRCGLKQLIFEPEILEQVEPDISLASTIMLLKEEDRKRIKGIVINKFRGNKEVLEPGFEIIENLTGVKTLGVIPYADIDIEDEDSLSEKYKSFKLNKNSNKIKVSVIKLKHISNVTDIDALSIHDDVEIQFVSERSQIGDEDLIIIPGSKNTIDDLKWLKESGIAEEIIKRARTKTIIFGICGGFQILGNKVKDPYHIEGDIEELNGLGLLALETIMENEKTLVQYTGKLIAEEGLLKDLNNSEIKGYEIHQGLTEGNEKNLTSDNRTILVNKNNIIATYLHGIFDNKDFTNNLLNEIRRRKGLEEVNSNISYEEYKIQEFDKLEKLVRENVDIEEIYKIIGLK